MQSSKWSLQFWLEVYNKFSAVRMSNSNGQEQWAVNEAAAADRHYFSQHVKIVNYEVFNQHRSSYQEGDFVVHYAGWSLQNGNTSRYDALRQDMLSPKVNKPALAT